MRMHSVLLLSLVLLLGPTQAIRGQSFYDDSSMRRDAAQRISDEHGLVFDWRKYSLSQLTDAELRLDAVKRIGQEHGLRFDWQKSTLSSLTDAELRLDAVKCIKQEHGVQFDWQKSSLSSLIDAELRMDAAKRISSATGKNLDWRTYSLTQLTQFELRLSQAGQQKLPSFARSVTVPLTRIEPGATYSSDTREDVRSAADDLSWEIRKLRRNASDYNPDEYERKLTRLELDLEDLSSRVAPHNSPAYKTDLTKPWNSLCGNNDDLTTKERKSYGLPQKDTGLNSSGFNKRDSEYPKNKDPFAAWNDPIKKSDPFAPHNDAIGKKDPFKPWNSPLGNNDDLTSKEREAYGLPPKSSSAFSTDETDFPRNKNPTAPWNSPVYKDSPLAPHNSPAYKTDLTKPWNSLCGNNDDLTTKERNAYGLPKKASGLGSFGIDEDDK